MTGRKKSPPLRATMIDRHLVVFRGKEPFLNWLNAHPHNPTDHEEMSLKELQSEPFVYLIPESKADDGAIEFVRRQAGNFFYFMLFDWYTDDEHFPKDMSYQNLKRWFEIEILDNPTDIGRYSIHHEYPEPFEIVVVQKGIKS
jgi:hypothetical protein